MEQAAFAGNRIQAPPISRVLTIAALVVPVISLVGWLIGSTVLASYGAKFIPMAPSTAICFILLSLALLITLRPASDQLTHQSAGVIGGLVAAYGSLVFIQGFTGLAVNPEGLFQDMGTLGAHRVGLMSPATGGLFLLTGISLAAFVRGHSRGDRTDFWLPLVAASGAAVALIALVFITAYSFGDPLLYERTIIPMALPTAFSFLFLGGGFAFSAVLHSPVPGRWHRMLSDLSIETQLRLGLGAIVLLVAAFGALAWVQSEKLSLQTRQLYDHPFTVSQALGDLELAAERMALHVRDLVLAQDEQQVTASLQDIEIEKDNADRQFSILYERYLGPREDIAALHDDFVKWNVLREETIRLLRAGKKSEAEARVGRGGIQNVQAGLVRKGLHKVDKFAGAKAEKFKAAATAQSEAVRRQLTAFVALILLLSIFISWLLLKGIKDPLRQLTEVTEQFRQGKLDSRSAYACANEFGTLSAAFNAMADAMQLQFQVSDSVARLAGVMLRDDELPGICRELLKALLEHTGSQVAAVYFLNEAQTAFEHFDSIGLGAGARTAFSATELEGELGMALATRRIQRISAIPADSRFALRAVSGEFQPREILTIPVLLDHTVVAVISLASVHVYAAPALRLVDDIWATLTARVNGVLAFRNIQNLAQRLDHQNRELDAQKRELTAQTDELNQQNTELEMQKRQLDEANRLKSAFLSNMSHELRTPLNSVIALSGVLHRRLEKTIPEEEHGYLEVIERNGRNLLVLINDILDLSRIEAGREEINVSQFSIRDMAGEIVAMVAPQAQERGITLTNLVSDELPAIASDADKCRHILQNLVANAVKFTESGSVEISAGLVDDEMQVVVRDTGIGIAADQIPFIFDEFRQADDSNSRRFGGTGLGLAIAKRYAQLLGGNIAVESTLGKGSIFTLRLPLALPDAGREAPARLPSRTRAGESTPVPSGHAHNILVVEDSEPAIIQLTDILGRQGYRLQVARNGREALAQIEQTLPEAMILDLMMPEVDGFAVLKAIRAVERTSRIPVLILTAKHVSKEELSFLKGNNIHELIQKGDVNKDELLAAVAGMVAPRPTKSVAQARPKPGEPRPAKPVVLVVEDNPDSMLSAKALLGDHYLVIEAANGQIGIQQARIHQPDIILMDIAMPVMDGIEALQAIRADTTLQHTPVIAVTASAMKGDRETILAHGFDGYLSKPLDAQLLQKALHDALD